MLDQIIKTVTTLEKAYLSPQISTTYDQDSVCIWVTNTYKYGDFEFYVDTNMILAVTTKFNDISQIWEVEDLDYSLNRFIDFMGPPTEPSPLMIMLGRKIKEKVY